MLQSTHAPDLLRKSGARRKAKICKHILCYSFLAPIVQWIKQLRPKEKLYVRIVVGAPYYLIHLCKWYNNHMAEAKTTKPKYFEDQFDDEEVLFVFNRHPIVMRKGIVIASAGLLTGPLYTLLLTVIYANNPEKYPSPNFFFLSLIASFGLSLLLFMPSWISWHFSVFILTDQRFIQITQKGLFHRAVADLGLSQIQSVNYEVAGLQETLLGFGTIKMQTYVGDMTIHDVHHPAKIQKKILSILRAEGINTTPYAPANEQKTNEETEDS
jgi:hypothetical protein